MDAATRSVADVMGWWGPHEFARDGRCVWCDAIKDLDAQGDCPDNEDPPTVDDMLAWLLAKNLTSFHFGAQGGGFYVDWGDDAAHAPTLHAALEAAVLAVADGAP